MNCTCISSESSAALLRLHKREYLLQNLATAPAFLLNSISLSFTTMLQSVSGSCAACVYATRLHLAAAASLVLAKSSASLEVCAVSSLTSLLQVCRTICHGLILAE